MPRHDHIPKWMKLLGDDARQKQNLFEKYPDNYRLDHPDQASIHKDCQSLESKSPIFLESELKNTLELILTYYCKTEQISYKSGLHEVLAPFFVMRFNNLKAIYGTFCAFVDKMMPKAFESEKVVDLSYQIFQKLMMYHEPIIFNALQASFPNHIPIVKKWFLTGLASFLDTSNLLKFWEYCLLEKNFTLSIFAAISIMYRQRDKFMKKNKLKNLSLEENEIDNVQDLIKEAVSYQENTPASFKKIMNKLLILGSNSASYLNSLASPILNISKKELVNPLPNYIIIDTRPYKTFSKGHFSQSFNLSTELPITTGKFLFRLEELWSILSGFTAYFHNKSAKSCHYIFIPETSELSNINTLCLDLVRRGIERVSLLSSSTKFPHVPNCLKCKLSKQIILLCKDLIDKKQILSLLWENYLAEINNLPENESKKLKETSLLDFDGKDLGGISIYDCLKLMWTNNLIGAENYFDAKKEEDPLCALHYAEAGFLKALLLGDSVSKDAVFERLNLAEKTATEYVKSWKSKGNIIFTAKEISKTQAAELINASQQLRLGLAVKAEATLFKSGTELIQRKLTTGSAHFRRAWKLYQKAKKLKEAQTVIEEEYFLKDELSSAHKRIELDIKNLINFGEGVIAIGITMAPSSMSKVAKAAIGIEIDQTTGIKQLYECINEKMGIRVPLALMFLCFWLLIYIPDYTPGKKERLREAQSLIRFSVHYYPQSPFFYWLESYLNQKQGNLERSLKLLNKVISKSKKLGLNVVPGRLNFERGWVLFLCSEWAMALKCLEDACEVGNSSAFANLLMGVCYCMAGNLEKGQSVLEQLEKTSNLPSERWVCKRASRYLQRRRFQIFPFELIYVTDSFSILKNEWLESSLDYLGHISMDIETQEEIEEKVIWILLKGKIFRLMGRLAQSVAALEEGIFYESQVREEIWVIPHIYYELAMNYAKSRDWDTSTKFIRLARGYKKKYEFSNALSFKLKSAMDMVIQEENKEFNK